MMKAWQHFKTITTHKMWVMRYCFKIGLYWQGLTHDLSKYSPTEFLVGMKYYQGDRSPNNAEREDTGMSKSWMHHKGRNKHHFEYWIDYGINCDTIIKGVPMPRRYVAEMIMDRISASRVYLGDAYTDQAPYQYLKKGIDHLCELCDGICGCSIRSFRSKIQGLCAVSPIIHALLFRRRRIYIGRLRKGGPLKKLVGRHQLYCIDTEFF